MKKIFGLLVAMMFMAPLFASAEDTMSTQTPPMTAMVNSTLGSMAGSWTGRGMMMDMKTNKMVPFVDHVTYAPALDNKFMHIDTMTEPDSSGHVFQGKGFMTYDPTQNLYHTYWFDSMGFGGEFIGTKQGNVITTTYTGKMGTMTMTTTLINDNSYRMSLQRKTDEGMMPVVDVTYTRISTTTPVQKTNTPYGY